jgi:hypothetical protein
MITAREKPQVRGLLVVGRLGIEPRTRGLKVRFIQYQPGLSNAISCHFRRSTSSRCVGGCRPVVVRSTTAEHEWSTRNGRNARLMCAVGQGAMTQNPRIRHPQFQQVALGQGALGAGLPLLPWGVAPFLLARRRTSARRRVPTAPCVSSAARPAWRYSSPSSPRSAATPPTRAFSDGLVAGLDVPAGIALAGALAGVALPQSTVRRATPARPMPVE